MDAEILKEFQGYFHGDILLFGSGGFFLAAQSLPPAASPEALEILTKVKKSHQRWTRASESTGGAYQRLSDVKKHPYQMFLILLILYFALGLRLAKSAYELFDKSL